MIHAIRLTVLSATGLVALVCAATASAAVIDYSTTLSGAAENPPNASPGSGTALVTVDTVANTMRVQATFSDLIGTTMAAHIHCCVDPFGNAPVATPTPAFSGFPLGVTSGAFDSTFDMMLASSYRAGFITDNGGTTAGAWAALLLGLSNGQTYFNIHTTQYPGGEIRGFLTAVPEPGSLALLGLGLAGLGVVRRRRASVGSDG